MGRDAIYAMVIGQNRIVKVRHCRHGLGLFSLVRTTTVLSMRLLAVLALILQLQPLVGSALCFHDAEIAGAECTMSHEERPASSTITTSDTGVPGGCLGMAYCAPAAPAVPKAAERFQITPLVHSAPALNDSLLAPGKPQAPPFHPPKA